MTQKWILIWLLSGVLLVACQGEEDLLPAPGQWRLINYWAIWCRPCREEIPELNALDQRDDIRVLGVNFDGKAGDELAEQIQSMGIQFQTLNHDPGPRLGAPSPNAIPVTLVVSPEGDLVEILTGPQTGEELLRAIQRSERTKKTPAQVPAN